MSSNDQTRHVWTIGSYPDIGRSFLSMAGHLVEAAGVGPGDRVLDVACGTGNVAITAARRGAEAVGVDITPAMLEDARENAGIAGTEDIIWSEGDATDLPFDDGRFDVSLSCVGHMFADPPSGAAEELLRVTRPGGTVAFTAWTPDSVVPAMASVLQGYLPPDPDPSDPPFLWGDPDTVRERLDDGVTSIEFETGSVRQKAMSPAHVWERVRSESGMFIVALDRVEPAEIGALDADMVDVIDRFFDDHRNVMTMGYRLATATVA